jgi:hypothetical protein
MLDSEPQTQQTPPPLPPPLPAPPAPPGPHGRLDYWPALLLYAAVAASAALCLQMSLLDPFSRTLGSAIAAGAFWIGFWRLNPAAMRLLLAICVVLSSVRFPGFSVALMAGSAVAGAVGARLTAAEADEDDFFFAPLLAALGVMALIFTVGSLAGLRGWGWGEVLGRGARHMELMRQETLKQFQEFRAAGLELDDEAITFLMSDFTLKIVTSLTVLWAFLLWLAGRLARRSLGRLRGLKPTLIMFRIAQRYIFLLILGLVLEIFSSLALREGFAALAPLHESLRLAAWPILGVVALAGLLAGLGIILFLAAVRRMNGQPQAAFWLTLGGVLMSLLYCHVTVLFGLADAWFDFRKLERLRRQLEAGGTDPRD